METTYRLQFNQKEQKFRLTFENDNEDWFTIFDNCTKSEANIYISLVKSSPKKKITKEHALKCASIAQNNLSKQLKKIELELNLEKKIIESLYSMKCLEFKSIENELTKTNVKKVPGGWIFYNYNETCATFVPYDKN